MEHTKSNTARFLFLVALFQFQFATAQTGSQINNYSFHSILFKISSPRHKQVSYLFGTHHAFGKAFFDSLTNANRALASCVLLIKENLNIPGEMAGDIINRRTTNTIWNKYLSPADLSFIENMFSTSPTDYKKMTPTEMYVFLNRHFKQQVCLNKQADDRTLSLDDYIGVKASEQHIELHGLETSEKQIELINRDVAGMPRKVHKRKLANMIDNIRSGNTGYCEETSWYAQMKIDYQLNVPCNNTLMLTERNNLWMETIKHQIKQKSCFIAVGLSHFMYECGLINQLKQLGYIVEPMAAE